MNTSIPSLLSGLPRGRRLGRAIRHRWPAVAVASVAAALPLGVALASGPAFFEGTSSSPAITARGINGVGYTLDSVGQIWAHIASTTPAILVMNGANGPALQAESKNGPAVDAHSSNGRAVTAISDSVTIREALYARGEVAGAKVVANNGDGLVAEGNTGVYSVGKEFGVVARSSTTAGSFAAGVQAVGDEAVVARGVTRGVEASAKGTAVSGTSDNEVGGFFAGKEAPIWMYPAFTPGAPTSGLHHRGELYVDSNGLLFYCTADGTPGTWHQIAFKN
jgi:hypothetical protein